ncbi:hypothetical protein DFH11DRAFT_1639534 [Phellopilus nigrolimitatus]|nr:hypothetical protein DFH11DRAFT_1639534 [Phellopilus nigrolimitatus]
MKAFLRIRSWLLDLVSLELHVLTNKGQNQRVKDLRDICSSAPQTRIINQRAIGSMIFSVIQRCQPVADSPYRVLPVVGI